MDQNEILERMIRMKKIIVKITRSLNPEIEGLNYTDIYVFKKIASEEGITMSRLSEITGFSSTLITFTVDELENYGLVERKKGRDRRQNFVVLSERGKILKDEINNTAHKKFSEMINNLDENEKNELINLFDRILSILEKVK